jgi:malate dehydrogenase
VELAVQVLSNKLNRHRVLGMGAEQDSLRFARAIAKDLEISRGEVRASVLGEHGQGMVPLWSSVRLMHTDPSLQDALGRLKELSEATPLRDRVASLQGKVSELLRPETIAEAYEATRRALPDARILVEPTITVHTARSTPNATANATLHCLAAAMGKEPRRVRGQVLLHGEFLNLSGVCGVPLDVNRDGWKVSQCDTLTSEEREQITASARSIDNYLSSVFELAANETVPQRTFSIWPSVSPSSRGRLI